MPSTQSNEPTGWTEKRLAQAIGRFKVQHNHSELQQFLRNRLEDNDPVCESNRARLWNELGVSLLWDEEFEEATACFQQSIGITPNSSAVYNLGNLALHRKDLKTALKQYDTVLKEDPAHTGALFNSAICHAMGENLAAALPLFSRVTQLEPENGGAHFWAGECLIQSGRYAEALPHFQKAFEQNPEHVETNSGLAIALYETEQYEEAVAACDYSLITFGPALLPLRIKGDALLSLDRVDAAVMCHLDMAYLDFDAREFLVNRIRRLANEQPDKLEAYSCSVLERFPDFEPILSVSLQPLASADTAQSATA